MDGELMKEEAWNSMEQKKMNRIYNEIINNYISKDSDFAIQIDGSWGCGKTYYIQNELLNVIQNTNKRPI